jgi:HSP20 family protein
MIIAPLVRTRGTIPAFRSLERSLQQLARDAAPANQQALQITQDDKAWTLRLDVPGVAREQLSIGIEGSVVRIETLADAPRYYKAAYELPQDIDAAASTAKLENGVLTLTLTKPQPVSKVTRVAVN